MIALGLAASDRLQIELGKGRICTSVCLYRHKQMLLGHIRDSLTELTLSRH